MTKIDEYIDLIVAEGEYVGLWELFCGPEGDTKKVTDADREEIAKKILDKVESGELEVFRSGWPSSNKTKLTLPEARAALSDRSNWQWPDQHERDLYWVCPTD